MQQLRRKDSATTVLHSRSLEAVLVYLNAQQQEEQREEEPHCGVVTLDDVWCGPGHVARKLLQQRTTFNAEHVDIVALIAAAMQCAFESRGDKQTYMLPCDSPMVRLIVVGGGGCGKTVLITEVLRPLFDLYFGPDGTVLQAQ